MADVVTLDVSGVLAAFEAEMTTALLDGAYEGAKIVAEEAAQRHPYTDRTGALTAGIGAEPATLTSGWRLTVRVVARKRYASFVDEGTKNKDGSQRNQPYPFLEPAYQRRMSGFVAALEVAMAQGAKKAFE